jgi:CBS domain containing-hemolysin-like protein
VISILITKDLVGNNFVGKSIKDASRGKVLRIAQDLNLDQTLNLMIREKSHIACVYNNFGTLLGIVTMEDVIEVIMRVEIMDESDDSTDLREVAEEMAPEMVRPEEELIEEQNGTL